MDPGGWRNALGTAYALPRWQWAPANVAELKDAVRRAKKEGRRIRMTGSGHSFSDVAMNEDWLLSPLGLTRTLPVDRASLRDGARPETLVRVQAGCTIRQLNAALAAAPAPLALENMGGADVQTFVGAASTGTHGSGLAYGPLASQIASIQVIGSDGQLLQIEPTDGITRPGFSGPLPEDPRTSFELRQNTPLFDALAVGLGCMGVIYAVTLRAVPKYWLVERRTLTTWEDIATPGGLVDRLVGDGKALRSALPDPGPLRAGSGVADDADPDHIEIYYTPYPDANRRHAALVTARWRVTRPPVGIGEPRGSSLFVPGEERLVALADKLKLLVPHFPHTMEDVRGFHVLALNELAQTYYANVSDEVFKIGVLNEVHAYGVELAFDLPRAKEAVALHFTTAEQLANESVFHSAPISLRFVKESSAYLAMQHGRKKMMMEIGVLAGLYGAEDLLRTYEDVFLRRLDARPHWGLDRNHLRRESTVAALYKDSWDSWKRALGELNPDGTFDGNTTDRLGISRR